MSLYLSYCVIVKIYYLSNIYWKNGRQKTTMGGLHNAQQNNPNAPSIKRRIKKPIP